VVRGTESDFRLEADLQAACVRWARANGWFARRYKGPGRRSHPDYLFAKNGRVVWIEFKLPGNEPTALQRHEIAEMRFHGLTVYWVDDLQDFKAILAAHEGAA
jgi:hypothetical protein